MDINYTKVCRSLLKNLPPKMSDVIERRFGLKTGKRETLEAIGKDHGITRERVRQIEEEGFSRIQSKAKNHKKVFQHFNDILDSFGGVKKEGTLLSFLGGKKYQNQALFLLTLTDNIEKHVEDKDALMKKKEYLDGLGR